jgi:hypothetical protein
MNIWGFARAGALVAVVAAVPAFDIAPAFAAEPVYDPPVGSRWMVETESRSEEVRPDGTATSMIKTRGELTIEHKGADGFRISYVQRDGTVEGNARSVPLSRAYMKVLENVVIRASTDRSGKPWRIDNLDEAKAAMRAAASGLVEQFDRRPASRALFDQLMSELVEVDAGSAASVYIDAFAGGFRRQRHAGSGASARQFDAVLFRQARRIRGRGRHDAKGCREFEDGVSRHGAEPDPDRDADDYGGARAVSLRFIAGRTSLHFVAVAKRLSLT